MRTPQPCARRFLPQVSEGPSYSRVPTASQLSLSLMLGSPIALAGGRSRTRMTTRSTGPGWSDAGIGCGTPSSSAWSSRPIAARNGRAHKTHTGLHGGRRRTRVKACRSDPVEEGSWPLEACSCLQSVANIFLDLSRSRGKITEPSILFQRCPAILRGTHRLPSFLRTTVLEKMRFYHYHYRSSRSSRSQNVESFIKTYLWLHRHVPPTTLPGSAPALYHSLVPRQ